MNLFKPCIGKMACRDNTEICLSCGRSLTEIAQLRDGIDLLANLAINQEYINIDEYCAYVAAKLNKSINHRRQNQVKQLPERKI